MDATGPKKGVLIREVSLFQRLKACYWDLRSCCSEAAKRLLLESNLLTHYDPALTLKMAADASPDGLGAVISHVLPDGVERPIALALYRFLKVKGTSHK